MIEPIRLLYVDDSRLDRELVRDALEQEQGRFRITEATNRAEFDARLAGGDFDLVLSDFHIRGFDGLEVIDAVQARDPSLPVMIVTGTGSEQTAVEAMKRGAADYVIKTPHHIRRLPAAILAALEKERLRTEQRRAEVDNARLYREAQEAIRLRDEFLSVAAHELKTPITSLKGFAQLTHRQLSRDEAVDWTLLRRAMQVIDRQSDKLTLLVSRLLDVSSIEAGQLQLNRAVVDVVALTREVLDRARVTSDQHDLVLHAPSPVPALVDPLRLEQVAVNLVDNAIKYSPQGGRIDVEVGRPDPETVQLAVQDHGVGIPVEHRQQIFERFHRAHSSPSSWGMGLGLYISRNIVELHGGRIEASFPPDGGTRFVVSLPSGLGSDPAATETRFA